MSNVFDGFIKIVLFFPIIVFMVLFVYNVMQDAGDDYIIAESYNVTLTEMQSGNLNVSQQMINHLEDARDQYYITTIPIDLVFLAVWIDFFLVTAYSSFRSRKKSILSFYGFITFGSMLFLFIGTFIDQVVVYLFENFYYNFFNLTRVATPIAEFYINNSQLLNFMWFVILILINQLDFKWVTGKVEGRYQQ